MKETYIAQGAVQIAGEHWEKIDSLLGIIIKMNTYRVRGNNFERLNPTNCVCHRAAVLFVVYAVVEQLSYVQFRPRFHQSQLLPR